MVRFRPNRELSTTANYLYDKAHPHAWGGPRVQQDGFRGGVFAQTTKSRSVLPRSGFSSE